MMLWGDAGSSLQIAKRRRFTPRPAPAVPPDLQCVVMVTGFPNRRQGLLCSAGANAAWRKWASFSSNWPPTARCRFAEQSGASCASRALGRSGMAALDQSGTAGVLQTGPADRSDEP